MKIKTNQRSSSFNEQLPKQQHSKSSHTKRLSRRSSAGDIDHARVIHVLAHPMATKTLPVDDIRPSIIENTIRLDNADEKIRLARLMDMSDSKIQVKTAPPRTLRTTGVPRPSQIDTIHLAPVNSKLNVSATSAANDKKNTPKTAHVKRIKMTKKKTNTTTAVAPLKSLIEEEKNDSSNHE
ncbi:unnamed protein product [Rotaria sp. Silwood2]|nr:unnamed protein product [Rotaria sp. Silwood2]CAF4353066.1 unnamed protein product [Rotaria sp. Silwood2]